MHLGIGPCQLPADADGRPLRPAILYGVDTRAYKEVAELTDRYGDDEIVRRCGNSLTAQAQGAKWLWLVRNEPWIYEKTRYFFMSHTYTVFRLTGEYVLDHLAASMCEPMYSPADRDWIPEWCEDVAPGLPLPRLMYSNQVAGHITAEGARATGLPEGIPVAVGTIDAFSEALSVGVKDPGQAMLMYGSTIVADVITDRATPHPALWSLTGTYENTFCLAGGLSASGALTTWLRDLVGGVPYAVLTEEAEEVPPGSNGLLALPYFAGERVPISDPHARGVVAGLTLGTTRGELYRALLEATAYGTRHLMESIAEAGAGTKRLRRGRGRHEGRGLDPDHLRRVRHRAGPAALRHRRQLRRRAPGRAGGRPGRRVHELGPDREHRAAEPAEQAVLRRPVRALPGAVPGDQGPPAPPGRAAERVGRGPGSCWKATFTQRGCRKVAFQTPTGPAPRPGPLLSRVLGRAGYPRHVRSALRWLRARLGVRVVTALAAALSVAVVLVLAGAALVLLTDRLLRDSVQETAAQQATVVAQRIEANFENDVEKNADDATAKRGDLVQVVRDDADDDSDDDSDGDAEGDAGDRTGGRDVEVVGASPPLWSVGPISTLLPEPGEVQVDLDARVTHRDGLEEDDPKITEDALVVAHGTSVKGRDLVVYAAQPLEEVHDAVETVFRLTVVGIPLLVLITAVVTYLAAGRALRPVEAIRVRVAAAGDDLAVRVPVPPAHDEVGRLAQTMNAMLARLQAAQAAQRRFVADASHELRSPLATIATGLELVSRGNAGPDAVDALRGETARLGRPWTPCCCWPGRTSGASRRVARTSTSTRWCRPSNGGRRSGSRCGWTPCRCGSSAIGPGSRRWCATSSTTPAGTRAPPWS